MNNVSELSVREAPKRQPGGQPSVRTAVLRRELREDELLRLFMCGKTTKECAALLRMSRWSIVRYASEPLFQEKLRLMSQDVWSRVDEEIKLSKISIADKIEDMSERALERLGELIESDDERVARAASSDVLDRNPETSRRTKAEITKREIQINPEMLRLAAQAAKEIGPKILPPSASEVVIDADR